MSHLTPNDVGYIIRIRGATLKSYVVNLASQDLRVFGRSVVDKLVRPNFSRTHSNSVLSFPFATKKLTGGCHEEDLGKHKDEKLRLTGGGGGFGLVPRPLG